jgi:hypothetical protein
MAASSLLVVLNSARLARTDPAGTASDPLRTQASTSNAA